MAQFFYAISFTGNAGSGMGVIVFDTDSGLVVGADAAGVMYDGSFKLEKWRLEARVLVTVPPGVWLVTGAPVSSQRLESVVNVSVPMDDVMVVIPVETPGGPVRLQLKALRTTA